MPNSSMPVNALSSVSCLLRGLVMLNQPGIRQFVWVPLLINLTIYALGMWAGFHYFAGALDGLIPSWLEWLRWLLWPLFALLMATCVFFSFTVLANVVASPFYGPLAEHVFRDSGVTLPAHESKGILQAAVSELAGEGGRLVYFAIRALPLLLLSFIPVVNAVAPFLWLVFGAWSLSLEYFSYPLDAQGVSFERQKALASEHRLQAMGFGALVMLGLSIPFLNIVVPPAAVIGATLYTAGLKRQE